MPQITSQNQLPSLESLRRFAARGEMHRFLEFLAFEDVYFHIDDFDQDTINLDYYALANSSGTSAANFAINVTGGTGVLIGDTGTDANGSISAIGPIIYLGDNHAGMWCRFKMDRVDLARFDVGFIDAVPATNASGVSDVDTPAVNMADGAIIHLDVAQTDTTVNFVTVGSTASQTVAATSFDLVTPVNATFMDVVIQLTGNDAHAVLRTDSGSTSVNGSQTIHHNSRADANNSAGFVEGGVALAPWLYWATTSGTAVFPQVDAIAVWSYRTSQ